MNRKTALVGGLALMLGSSICGAASGSAEIAAIKKALATSYPEVQITDIQPSPVPGLYEVFSPDAVVYVDRTGEFLFGGPLVATKTKTDLSKQALENRDPIHFDELPLNEAIKTVRGTGERVIAVFADPDCPYCHNLEKELAGLTDVTIYTFLYPLTALHPDARNKARALWCAPDRSEAWHDWMILDKGAPAPAADCKDPLDDLQALGARIKIESTPAIFLENGHRIRGTRPSAQLNAMIVSAHTEKLHAAANSGTPPRS
jgi:thiol:disulfide interchange protein DsbC